MMQTQPFVLIVDDVAHQRKLYELISERVGISSHVVSGYEEAVEALDFAKFDLIIVDWMLEDVDGLTASKFIRAKLGPEAPPILCITARAMQGDREKVLSSGINDYLSKPFTIEQFNSFVYKWMEGSLVAENKNN
jgi:CheY-like chemotaxis protein